jgi:hypothetical protein
MAGLVPAIHVFRSQAGLSDSEIRDVSAWMSLRSNQATKKKDVDARIKSAHDGFYSAASRRSGGGLHRSAERSSLSFAATHAVRSAYSICFQNGARVFR